MSDMKNEAGDQEEVQADGAEVKAVVPSFMNNPEVLGALQGRLSGMVGLRSGYIESLPAPVKRRVKALKKLQFEVIKIESEFYKEVHELECKYAAKYNPIFAKRADVTNGLVEPKDEECDWPSDEEEDELAENMKAKAAIVDEKSKDTTAADENVKGVPEFWLTVFKNVELLSDMLQEHDEPILKHLMDIQVVFNNDPMGFTLEFSFSPNDYFSNPVLWKKYFMRADPDSDDPFGYEGPEIYKCEGCNIDWKANKNVTVKVVKKTQKHKNRGTKRTVTKTVQADSFFNFFSPPKQDEAKEDEPDEDTEALLAADFEIGHYLRERIVPRAVLYFTGEADDEEYDEEVEEEEEGDDVAGDDEDDDDEDDPDFNPGQGPADKPDCKQQ
jgi:nucleosome assembly protein 1-like 1